MSLVELICPACARSLSPGPGQRIHACRDCGRSWEAVAGRGLLAVERALIRPRIAPSTEAPLHLVPVWCIAVHREELGEVARRMAAEIRVPATGIARLPLLVECARRLTRAAAPWEPWPDLQVVADPAEIDAETAFAIAEAVALRHVPGWPRDAEVESVRIPLGGARLVDWPCAVEGSDLVELVGGLSLSRALVEQVEPRDQRAALGPAIAALNLPREFTPTRSGS